MNSTWPGLYNLEIIYHEGMFDFISKYVFPGFLVFKDLYLLDAKFIDLVMALNYVPISWFEGGQYQH